MLQVRFGRTTLSTTQPREITTRTGKAVGSTYDSYVIPVRRGTWDVAAAGPIRFSWEYDPNRERLMALYQKGKDKQWDAHRRLDWSQEVDRYNIPGSPDELNPLLGSDIWERMTQTEQQELMRHYNAWVFSQFLHGEQGALVIAARIVESAPDLDAKFYSATQVMDEARHVELYSRFIDEKIGIHYPVNQDLARLLEDALSDGRWDLPYLAMQVLVEGVALASFGMYRDTTVNPFVRQLLAYVMEDEARHVAFGRIALKDYYNELTQAELRSREEFLIEGCYLLRDRLRGQEVFETMGLPVKQCLEYIDNAPLYKLYQALLFSRIVPCVRDIGLWGSKVQEGFRQLNVLDAATTDLEALIGQDEEIAEQQDRERQTQEMGARRNEVDEIIASARDDRLPPR